MEIISVPQTPFLDKQKIEVLQKRKTEYKHLGEYNITKGLKLFYYNHISEELGEVPILRSTTIKLVPIDGKLFPMDSEHDRAMIDSRNTFFECLNFENARRRILRFKNGEIKDLFNLKPVRKTTINIFDVL